MENMHTDARVKGVKFGAPTTIHYITMERLVTVNSSCTFQYFTIFFLGKCS